MNPSLFDQPTAAEGRRLTHLAKALADGAADLRWVGYGQAEADVRRLAGLLRKALGAAELERCRFAAIPRGGWIVLGMLAYALDVSPDQASDDGPLVLVDDCALSGARLATTLAATPAGEDEIVVAHLYSHPELRRQVVAREPKVRSCLAARDLASRGPSDDPRWQQAWRARLGEERYWIGRTERLAFPWNEPDQPFWNAATGEIEDGWRLVPPHRCLKTSRLLGGALESGARRLADDVAYGEFDDRLWLCHLPSRQVYALDGAGRDGLKALLRFADRERAVAALVATYDAPPERLAADLAALAEALTERHLLAPPGEP